MCVWCVCVSCCMCVCMKYLPQSAWKQNTESQCVCVCLLPSWLKHISVGNNCKANRLDSAQLSTKDGRPSAEAPPLTETTVWVVASYISTSMRVLVICVCDCVCQCATLWVRGQRDKGEGPKQYKKTNRPWDSPLAAWWLEGRVMWSEVSLSRGA